MTLEYTESPNGSKTSPTIVECPFCGVDLRGREPPFHFVKCPEVPR
jgi:hypothetical protein